jgi:hypothetical protein
MAFFFHWKISKQEPLMRIALLIAGFFAAIPQLALTQEPKETVRDPWRGFGLGSTVRTRTRTEKAGDPAEEVVETSKVRSIRVGGWVGVDHVRVVDGKEEHSTRYHIAGTDPVKLGLKLDSKTEAKLIIDGKPLPVMISKWISVTEKEEPHSEVRITFYEAKTDDVEIPYHEIDIPGPDLSVGPRVVKAELHIKRLSKENKVIAETRFTETARKLADGVDINGKKVRCVVFDVEGAETDQKGKFAMKGEIWYSNAVAGREIKKKLTVESAEGKRTIRMAVEDFSTLPDVPVQLDLAKLLADKERQEIPDPTWNKMRLGAWYAKVSLIQPHGAKNFRSFDVTAHQVVQIIPGGNYVILRKELTDKGWKDKEYELISPPKPAPKSKDEKITREEIMLLGGKVLCDKRAFSWKQSKSSGTGSEWVPVDEKWQKVLANSGLKYLKESRQNASKDSFRTHIHKTEGMITSLSTETFVAGKAVSCVRYKTVHWEGETPWFGTHEFFSKTVPTWSVASIDTGKADYSFTHILDFSEVDRALPTLEQLRGPYQQAARLLKTVPLDKAE